MSIHTVIVEVHALEGVVPGLTGIVDGDIVSPVCLVNVDVALANSCRFYYFDTELGGLIPGLPFLPYNTTAGQSGHRISVEQSRMRCRWRCPCALDS